jgi:hypothetical protein
MQEGFRAILRPDSHTCGNGLGLYIVESVFRLLALDYSFEPMIEPTA